MALSLLKILNLPYLKNLQCEAGEQGLDKIITSTGLLDYEPLVREPSEAINPLYSNSLVLTSFLFAKDDPDMIFPVVKELVEKQVGALAYKKIFYDTLPKEVLVYANKKHFPIFSFEETYFENIIFNVMEAIRLEDNEILTEHTIHKMIHTDMTRAEAQSFANRLSLDFNKYLMFYYITLSENERDKSKESIAEQFYMSKALRQRSLLSTYKNGYFLLITLDSNELADYENFLKQALPPVAKSDDNFIITRSRIHSSQGTLDIGLRESYNTSIGATVLGRHRMTYDELGTLKFLIPLCNTPELQIFKQEIVDKLKEEQELYDTAIEYVKAQANINETAQACFCHPNTIRYRIKRMKQLINASQESDYAFYEKLSIALKLEKLQSTDF